MRTKTSPREFFLSQGEQPCLDEFTFPGNGAAPPKIVRVYKYQPGHREAVRRICCDTGFLGQPIDLIFRDRELFADLLTKAYLDYEPDWALIVESDGQVVGYLLGSVSPRFQRNLMVCGFQTATRMLANWVTGKYSDHPRSERFVRWVLTKGMRELPKRPENAAHLHMNLERSCRGSWRVLKILVGAFEELLRQSGRDRYYGQFFSCPERHPENVYSCYGLTFFDKQLTTIFQPEIPDPTFVICMEKRLAGQPHLRSARRASHSPLPILRP